MVRYSIPTLKAMLTKASVAIVHLLAVNSSRSNRFLN